MKAFQDKITCWEGLLGSEEDWEEIIDQADYQVEWGEFLQAIGSAATYILYLLLLTAMKQQLVKINFSPLLLERAALDSYRKELSINP